MSHFTILMYEDETDWKDSFEYSLKLKLAQKGIKLNIVHRLDDDTLEEDLLISSPNLIMVDHDLGEITGEQIIGLIEGDPEYTKVSIYYYSGGESLDDLTAKAKQFNCHVQCFTKEGDSIEDSILKLVDK